MAFRLSARSLSRLADVHPDLVRVVQHAITITPVDFTVLEGVRSIEKQEKLVASGASQTMNSRHLSGHAVDLGAYEDGGVRWDWPLYFQIADAVREAAYAENVSIEWGGAWGRVLNHCASADAANDAYTDECRALGRKPFLDGPHYQLPWDLYPK